MQRFSSKLLPFLVGLSLSLCGRVDGFTTNLKPSAVVTTTTTTTTTTLNLHQWNDVTSLFIADGDVSDVVAATTAKTAEAVMDIGSALPEQGGGGLMDIVKNIAVAITAVLFLGAGLTVVTASIIVPAAAKELETECKDLAPELWEEYMGKLEEGQTMANRPDLMQELGAKLQPLLDAKMERQFAQAKAEGKDVSKDEQAWKALDKVQVQIPTKEELDQTFDTFTAKDSTSSPPPPPPVVTDQWGGDDDIVDAEVIKKTDESK